MNELEKMVNGVKVVKNPNLNKLFNKSISPESYLYQKGYADGVKDSLKDRKKKITELKKLVKKEYDETGLLNDEEIELMIKEVF